MSLSDGGIVHGIEKVRITVCYLLILTLKSSRCVVFRFVCIDIMLMFSFFLSLGVCMCVCMCVYMCSQTMQMTVQTGCMT